MFEGYEVLSNLKGRVIDNTLKVYLATDSIDYSEYKKGGDRYVRRI